MIRAPFIAVILGALVLQGCASPQVSVGMLMPATSNEAAKLRRVAVLPFRGRNGREVAEKLEAKLVNVSTDKGPWFNVYERERLQSALKELRLGRSGLVDVNTAARLGRFIGVQAIYMGSVDQKRTDKSTYYEDRQVCVERNKKDKCVRRKTKSIRCRRRDVAFSFTAKVVNVETARVAYSRSVSKSGRDSTCNDNFRNSDQNAQDYIMDKAIVEFTRRVAPHYSIQKIVIKDDTDDLKGEQAKFFKAGVTFAKENRMDRACELWNDILFRGGKSMPLYYNLGVCREYKADLGEAESWYFKADRMLMKPDEDISKALNRVRQKSLAQDKLQRQMR